MTDPGPDASCLPNFALIYALTANLVPLELMDGLLELCLGAVYDQARSPSLQEWLKRVASVEPKAASFKVAKDIQDKMALLDRLGLDSVYAYMNDIKLLVPTDDEENSIATLPLHRSSPLALYIRRVRMSFLQLSFDQSDKWWTSVQAWMAGTWIEPEWRTPKDKAADRFKRAMEASDYQAARDALSYYDFEQSQEHSSRPQHGLLNLALLEFKLGGWSAAHEALTEAVQVARNVGDSECLIACSSLHKRLVASAPTGALASTSSSTSGGLVLSDSRPSPTDLLWDAKSAAQRGAPLPSLFTTLYASRALHYAPPLVVERERERGEPKDKVRQGEWVDDEWESGWEAASAALWDGLGARSIADLHDEIALTGLRPGAGWDTRLAVLRRKAMHWARDDRVEEALCMLLAEVDAPEGRRAMGLADFAGWQAIVWDVVRIQAQRCGQDVVVERLDRLNPPEPITTPPRATLGPEDRDADAETLYTQGRSLLTTFQPVQALPYLLQAYRLANISHALHLRLRAFLGILTARMMISPAVAEAERSLAELEQVWGEVIKAAESDRTVRAEAECVRARAVITAAEGDDAQVALALAHLQLAFDTFSEVHQISDAQEPLGQLCRLYDHLSLGSLPPPGLGGLSWVELRDRAAELFMEREDEVRRQRGVEVDGAEWTSLREVVDAVKRAVLVRVTSPRTGVEDA